MKIEDRLLRSGIVRRIVAGFVVAALLAARGDCGAVARHGSQSASRAKPRPSRARRLKATRLRCISVC